MITFWKENYQTITKMLVNQLGMMIFGFVVAQATCNNESLLLAGSLFSVLFYLVLLYNVAWESGARDKIRLDGGRMEYLPLKGLYLSLMANIPNMILGVLVIVGFVFGRMDGGFAYEWAGNLFVVSNFIARIFEAMYLGLIQLYSPYNPIAFLLIILPALAVCCAAYLLGVKTIRIASLLGIKTKEARKAEESQRVLSRRGSVSDSEGGASAPRGEDDGGDGEDENFDVDLAAEDGAEDIGVEDNDSDYHGADDDDPDYHGADDDAADSGDASN